MCNSEVKVSLMNSYVSFVLSLFHKGINVFAIHIGFTVVLYQPIILLSFILNADFERPQVYIILLICLEIITFFQRASEAKI